MNLIGLLYSHALDHVGCMQIYLRFSKSIATKKQVFNNQFDTIEKIDLENNLDVPKLIPIDVDCSKVVLDLVNTIIFRLITLPCF